MKDQSSKHEAITVNSNTYKKSFLKDGIIFCPIDDQK